MCQPGRPGGRPSGVQVGSPGTRRLPEDEVPRVLLVVLVGVDARARLDALVVQPRELAVLRERRDLEVDRPFVRVGVSARLEVVNHLAHRLEVLGIGRPRRLLDRLQPERRRVVAERLDPAVGVLAQRHARALRLEDRPVVDVREVHDLPDAPALLVLEHATQHVEADEGAEVADVAPGVDRQAARVHPHGAGLGRLEGLFPTGQGVIQAQARMIASRPERGLSAPSETPHSGW